MTIDVTALEMLPAEASGLRPCGQILTCLWTCSYSHSCLYTLPDWDE